MERTITSAVPPGLRNGSTTATQPPVPVDPTTSAAGADLLLKVTPPRASREHLGRGRLALDRERPIGVVQAAGGFGKTSLLAQWRLEHLAHGAAVAWLTASDRDDPQRLVQALALAVRVGAGRPTFGHTLLEAAPAGGLEGVTTWLAELAQSALDLVLVVDESDRLPPDAREALGYLLRNAPPNLRVRIGARPDDTLDQALGLADLVAYGEAEVVRAPRLRFQLDETFELVRRRFGAQVDADTIARLHELSEGWPLGLQLMLGVLAAGAEPRAEVAALAARSGALHDHLVDRLLAHLSPDDAAFLTRIAVLDRLHPRLCNAVAECDDAAERLTRLGRDTAVFGASEQGEWLRMHTLAREPLRRRFAASAPAQQAAAHARAAQWLAAEGQLEHAARHALEAGLNEQAYEWAERSLYDSLMARGRQAMVLDWLRRLPDAELARRPRLLLAAAWSLALSERHDEAGRLVERLLALPDADDALRCECALILGGAAVFADLPDRFAELHDPWDQAPPLRDRVLLHVHANRSAFRLLIEGRPAQARLRQQQAPAGGGDDAAAAYIARWGDVIVGLSYLVEGQVRLAENLLQPALARADADLGRRSMFSATLATLLAAALWERDQPAAAAATLANRLDVLERSALPEALLLAYRTLARIALAEGAEDRALELLGAMQAVGVARRLPRLVIVSLADQVRLHARRHRADTCRALLAQIDAQLADPGLPTGRLWRRSVSVWRDSAAGLTEIAAQQWRAALAPLQQALAQARALGFGRVQLELSGLLALAGDRCGERTEPQLREALDLARAFGLGRVFADAHPALDEWVRKLGAAAAPAAGPAPLAASASTAPAARPRAAASMVLTPKEREVLELLARNLSNKEIGLALQVGEETVKWHVKNLFAKLDAGTRKQVVQRARILGLLTGAD
jgi:LuxR family maltose regulon positive regulatory protein